MSFTTQLEEQALPAKGHFKDKCQTKEKSQFTKEFHRLTKRFPNQAHLELTKLETVLRIALKAEAFKNVSHHWSYCEARHRQLLKLYHALAEREEMTKPQ
ncbi:MAG: hypothetical protein AAFV69_15395 [Pseudomonadota bacterium]